MDKKEKYRKMVETNLANDPDHYKKIGAKGGKNTTNRPFKDKKLASIAGFKSAEVRRKKALEKSK